MSEFPAYEPTAPDAPKKPRKKPVRKARKAAARSPSIRRGFLISLPSFDLRLDFAGDFGEAGLLGVSEPSGEGLGFDGLIHGVLPDV